MADPSYHLVGSFLEISQITGGPKYIQKGQITLISTSPHRITIHMKDHSDPETLSFVNQENQRRFIQQLLADISSEESEAVAFKDALEAVKDAMGNVKRMQEDLSNSLNNVATYLQEFKDEIKEDLQDSITEFTSVVEDRMTALENLPEPKKKSPYEVLHTGKDDHWCNIFVMVAIILMVFFGLFSMDKNIK
jgi:hypothetical protein